MSPLLDDSVKDGVPSVHVGVEPSTEAGGVHAKPLEWLECPAPELPDSTLNVDLFSIRDSSRISEILQKGYISVHVYLFQLNLSYLLFCCYINHHTKMAK